MMGEQGNNFFLLELTKDTYITLPWHNSCQASLPLYFDNHYLYRSNHFSSFPTVGCDQVRKNQSGRKTQGHACQVEFNPPPVPLDLQLLMPQTKLILLFFLSSNIYSTFLLLLSCENDKSIPGTSSHVRSTYSLSSIASLSSSFLSGRIFPTSIISSWLGSLLL